MPLPSIPLWMQNLRFEQIVYFLAAFPIAWVIDRVVFYSANRSFVLKKWIPTNLNLKAHLGTSIFWLASIFVLETIAALQLADGPVQDRLQNFLAICLIVVCSWAITKAIS